MSTNRLETYSCHKCHTLISDPNNILHCASCKHVYEFDCAGYSEKLYRLLSKESKKKWKCKKCLRLNPSTSTNEISNVTIRNTGVTKKSQENKKHLLLSTQKDDVVSEDKIFINVSTENSFDTLSTINNTDKLMEENINLKKSLQDELKKNSILQSEVNYLKHNKETINNTQNEMDAMEIITPLKHKIKKKVEENIQLYDRITELENENKKLYQMLKDASSTSISSNSNKDKQARVIETKAMQCHIKKLNLKIRNLQNNLTKMTEENENLNKELEELKSKAKFISHLNNCSDLMDEFTSKLSNYMENLNYTLNKETDKDTLKKPTNCSNNEEKCKKPKLLLLSDYHGTEIISSLSKIRKGDYNFNADIIYMATTNRVLKDVETKTAQFSKRDCVVIMCGVNDYNVRPIRLVLNDLETCVKKMTHTNIVLCHIPNSVSPNSTTYNEYVNRFNSALSRRFASFKQVYLQTTDPNLNEYDYQCDGYKLCRSGKFKLACSLNHALKSINEHFYNSSSFL